MKIKAKKIFFYTVSIISIAIATIYIVNYSSLSLQAYGEHTTFQRLAGAEAPDDVIRKWIFTEEKTPSTSTPVPKCYNNGTTDELGNVCMGSWMSLIIEENQVNNISASIAILDWQGGNRFARASAICRVYGPGIDTVTNTDASTPREDASLKLLDRYVSGVNHVAFEETKSIETPASGEYTVTCDISSSVASALSRSPRLSFSKKVMVTKSTINDTYSPTGKIKTIDGITEKPIPASWSLEWKSFDSQNPIEINGDEPDEKTFSLPTNKNGRLSIKDARSDGYNYVSVTSLLSNFNNYDSRKATDTFPFTLVDNILSDHLDNSTITLRFFKFKESGIRVFANKPGVKYLLCRTKCIQYETTEGIQTYSFPDNGSNSYTLTALDNNTNVTDSVIGAQKGFTSSRSIEVKPGNVETFMLSSMGDINACVNLIAVDNSDNTNPSDIFCEVGGDDRDRLELSTGKSAVLKWNTRGLSECRGSWVNDGNDLIPLSGRFEVPAASSTKVYTIDCSQ